MSEKKIIQKVRFLPFFPYGICSKPALAIEGKTNRSATVLMHGDDPDATIDECLKYRAKIHERAKYLCEKGYAKDVLRTCGTPAQKRSFRYITKKGLLALVEAPKGIPVEMDGEEEITRENDGNKKGIHSYSNPGSYAELRELLYDYGTSDDPASLEAFDDLLLESVINGNDTPLTAAISLVGSAKITTSKYSRNQLYNIWRLSHINAMFLANDHLTYLDRRPYDTGFAIDGIEDEESYGAYLEKYGNTMAALSYRTLTNWYRKNPGYYQITQRYPDTSEDAKEAWLRTPAFYSPKELPNVDDKLSVTDNADLMGSRRKLFHIFVGLATGKNINYLCYHGKTGPFKWVPTREANAKEAVTAAVREMKTQCPEMQCNDSVDFGLYFCSSIHQFIALFERTIEKHKPGKKGNYLTDKPFTSLHAIPVNDSGTFLLWCLLEYSPMETEEIIVNSLIRQDDGFSRQTNRWYPLTYKGKRVFLGYTMDISKINHVLEDHLDDQDFYICCFPEQSSWYQKLLPGHTIL